MKKNTGKRWNEVSFKEFVKEYNKRLNNNDELSECSLRYIYDYYIDNDSNSVIDYAGIIDSWRQGTTQEEIEDTYNCDIQMCDELENGGVIAYVENNY